MDSGSHLIISIQFKSCKYDKISLVGETFLFINQNYSTESFNMISDVLFHIALAVDCNMFVRVHHVNMMS